MPFAILWDMESLREYSFAGWGWLVLFGVASFIGYLSWDYGIRKGNVVYLSLGADFIPWMSLFATHLFIAVNISSTTAVAAFVLVVGAIITRYGTLPQSKQTDWKQM